VCAAEERNLSGVKQLGCVVVINGVDEHGVRDTGDEFADAFVTDERRESCAVRPCGRRERRVSGHAWWPARRSRPWNRRRRSELWRAGREALTW
jgi:hypothetical protein